MTIKNTVLVILCTIILGACKIVVDEISSNYPTPNGSRNSFYVSTETPHYLSSPDVTKPTKEELSLSNGYCLKDFSEFAYLEPDPNKHFTGHISPSSPWSFVEDLSGVTTDSVYKEWFVSALRYQNGFLQIWIGVLNGDKFLVYQPDKDKWESISASVGASESMVEELFVTSDGSLWGKNRWPEDYHETSNTILSKFNEVTKRFEFVEKAPIIPPLGDGQRYHWSDQPQIALDNQDVFWFLLQKDGIYRYNPIEDKMLRLSSLPPGEDYRYVDQLVIGSESFIYYTILSFGSPYGYVYEFDAITQITKIVDTPFGTWVAFQNMNLDNQGRLWLGAMAYRNTDGTWNLLHPDAFTYIEKFGYWSNLPFIVLSDSNGRLWYTKRTDYSAFDGTAWFDPETGAGCQFTTFVVPNMVEDSDHTIWMVANNKLFKYSLRP